MAQIRINNFSIYIELTVPAMIGVIDCKLIPIVHPQSQAWFVITRHLGADDGQFDIIATLNKNDKIVVHNIYRDGDNPDADILLSGDDTRQIFQGEEIELSDGEQMIVRKLIELYSTIGEEVFLAE
jgi:hypothetical protein